MTEPVPAVRIRDLHKSYGAVQALRGIDLEIRPGQFFGVLGPNGAGKSTTIHILTGLVTFHSIHMLPDFWRGLSLFNPIFYMVNGLRYGVLGVADASPWLSFLISVGLAVVLFGWTVHLFKVGYRLKS